jgi:hypothetical protein
MSTTAIPLFDRSGHPSVPTWRLPKRCAQALSRRPLAAPAKPARSVLDRAEHSAKLIRQGRHHRRFPGGVTAPPKTLIIGGESPRLKAGSAARWAYSTADPGR